MQHRVLWAEVYPKSAAQASATLHLEVFPSFKVPFSFKVVDARIDARPGNSKLVLSFYKVLVQSRILRRIPNGGDFYPASGFQHPVSIPASTTPNQLLH
jgi:hypothetical protein